MKKEGLSESGIKYIVARLIERGLEAREEYYADKTDMLQAGRHLAYYEMLDILQSEILIHDQDLKEFVLDINLEK